MVFRKNGFINREKIKSRRIYFFGAIFAGLILLFLLINILLNNKNKTKIDSEKNLIHSITKNESKSIFNISELNIKELKNKIILLNVYNIRDFSYIFSVDLAEKLEKLYKNKIIIIDVITDRINFDNNLIINYIVKDNIERPVISVDDFDLKEDTRNDTRYFVLINEKGAIQNIFYENELNKNTISSEIDKLLENNPKIDVSRLSNIYLEKDNVPESFIKSLSRIKYINKIEGTNNVPYFIVSDAKSKRIYLMTINGNIVNQIGSGKTGNSDGTGINASFCYPLGFAIENDKNLYVADICNNSIRKVDLKTLEVSTLISDNEALEKPMDIEYLDNNLIISIAKNNPLIKYNIKSGEITQINFDNGGKNIIKLNKYNNKVYFISSEGNGLYSIDNQSNINKEIDFEKINKEGEVKIDENQNFHIDETGLYIVDKFENKIFKIKDEKIKEYSGNTKDKIYNLPTDIVDVKDKLYIANENDKKLIQIDKNTTNAKVININFGYEYNRIRSLNEEFLNVNNIREVSLKNGNENRLIINLKNGYSLEGMAPQSLTIFKEDRENNSAILIKSYSKNEIMENSTLIIPELENNAIYYIKGNFYYCNYDKKTPCLVNRFERRIKVNNTSDNKKLIINFLYQQK